MSLDPFEARLQFLKQLRSLNASQQSIAKLVSFAVKYGSRCGDDLWECVVDEVEKASLNARINILYFLDGLADASAATGPPDAPYLPLIERSLSRIVSAVVPDTRDGVLNLKSARAMLSSWRSRRVLDTSVVECALAHLDARTFAKGEKDGKDGKEEDGKESKEERSKMSRADILSRIEQDRERHKRLRERIWILPIPPLRAPAAPAGSAPSPASTSPFTPASPAPHASTSSASAAKLMPPPTASTSAPRPPAVSPLDVEFEQMWETMSDFGDDDAEGMRESVRAAGLELAA